VLAVSAALRGAREVTAVDVSRKAVLTARLNARLNGVRVQVLRGDLFAPLRRARFDAIVSNPPYVPAHSDTLPARGPARAWDAGRDGRALLGRICAAAPGHLRPGGVLLVVQSSLLDTEATEQALRAGGLEVDMAARERGPLGPLMRERRAAGLVAPVHEEDVLVLRGRKAASTRCRSAQRSVTM